MFLATLSLMGSLCMYEIAYMYFYMSLNSNRCQKWHGKRILYVILANKTVCFFII